MMSLSEYGRFALRAILVCLAAVTGVILIFLRLPDTISLFDVGVALVFVAFGGAFGISRPSSDQLKIVKYQALAVANGVKIASPKPKEKKEKSKEKKETKEKKEKKETKEKDEKTSVLDDFMKGFNEIKEKLNNGNQNSSLGGSSAPVKVKIETETDEKSGLVDNIIKDLKEEKDKLETPPEGGDFELSIHVPE